MLPGLSPPSQEGLVAEAVLAAEAGGGGVMLVELREPVLALGLGIVSSVGHDCHHDTQRRDDEIQLKGLLGLLPKQSGGKGNRVEALRSSNPVSRNISERFG